MNAELGEAFAIQSRICNGIGSPLYGELLRRCASELSAEDRNSPLWRLLDDWTGDVARDFVPLRVLGGVHALVLAGRAPDLARHYPSAGGEASFPGCWNDFRAVVAEHGSELQRWLSFVPQTNEVQRSASLLGGFLEIGARFGLPLRLRELGASAGLNLFWSEYRYELGVHRWGAAGAPLALRTDWQGEPPRLDAPVVIESRAGCDRRPIDVTDPDALLRLRSYFWPDQVDRLTRLSRATELLKQDPPRLDQASAIEWLASELEVNQPSGVCLVVYHSSFWSYLSDLDQQAIRKSLERAGAAASPERPLAWLRAEDEPPALALRVRCWPSGRETRLASLHPHGSWIHWSPSEDG